jgi:Zn-dependent protease
VRRQEMIDIAVAFIVLTIAFSLQGPFFALRAPELATIGMIGLAVGVGFICHELGHKYVALHYGHWAEFRASKLGLVAMLVMAVMIGFVFAAPGAVMITEWGRSTYNKREVGNIALAGPVVNLAIAAIFFAGLLVGMALGVEWIAKVALLGTFINVYLAGFNMLPFGPLDGKKIMEASPRLWAIVGIPSIGLGLLLLFGMVAL